MYNVSLVSVPKRRTKTGGSLWCVGLAWLDAKVPLSQSVTWACTERRHLEVAQPTGLTEPPVASILCAHAVRDVLSYVDRLSGTTEAKKISHFPCS